MAKRFVGALACALLVVGCTGGDPAVDAAESLVGDLRSAGSDPRAVETLDEAITGLPHDVKVLGVADEDSNGRDDDGFVSVTADGHWACVTLPDNGEDADVGFGACS